jgi:hypothetical protein
MGKFSDIQIPEIWRKGTSEEDNVAGDNFKWF